MKNETSSLIFKQPALNPRQRLYEFSWVLKPANAFHSSFFILHSYNSTINKLIFRLQRAAATSG
jgi:hypothetical protein